MPASSIESSWRALWPGNCQGRLKKVKNAREADSLDVAWEQSVLKRYQLWGREPPAMANRPNSSWPTKTIPKSKNEVTIFKTSLMTSSTTWPSTWDQTFLAFQRPASWGGKIRVEVKVVNIRISKRDIAIWGQPKSYSRTFRRRMSPKKAKSKFKMMSGASWVATRTNRKIRRFWQMRDLFQYRR